MKLANGNYVFMIYKPISGTEYYYGFAEFNPTTKEIRKIATNPEFPIYTAAEPTAWAFGINTAKDPATDYIYISGINSVGGPLLSRLYAFNPATGELSIPAGETPFDYYIYSSSKAWINGNLLCTGGTIDGSNFNITNAVKLLRPQNSLSLDEPRKPEFNGTVFPNPANTGFTIQSDEPYKSARFTDLSGRIIQEFKLTDQSNFVDTRSMTNGLYLVSLFRKDGTFDVVKLVVQHE
jgi:hypothetical protein